MIQSWKLGLAWLVMSGAITSLSFANAFYANCASAQIIPDNTLGNENSTVKSTGSVDAIDGGATRGTNLFHSFQEFNVGEGRSVYFTNPAGIENILSRVTGGNPSQILGKLGVLGNANLFLINPNGIIFGQNASLDVRGSFVGTTANGIGLTNGDIFSANPQAPLPTRLLNVNPNALLFNQLKAQEIVNRSTADSRGLQVPQGRSLLLVGGDVSLEGGKIFAPSGRVELGSVAGSGTVGLNVNNSDLRLSFPDGLPRADIFLNNGADVNVRAGGGGSIAVNAQNLNLAGGSSLEAGIDYGLGSIDSQAGNIEVNATGTINLTNNSLFANWVASGATGKGGNINITTGSLSATDGAKLFGTTYGQGEGGNININARGTVSFDGVSSNGSSSGVVNNLDKQATGKAGNINITADSLEVKNGARLRSQTRGQGDAGNVNINARNTVSLDGVGGSDERQSSISSLAEAGDFKGNAGDINIETGSLFVTNGALVETSSSRQANAGSLNINARDKVVFDGVGGSNQRSTAVFSTLEEGGIGNAGDINISTSSLEVKNGAQLQSLTAGQGNAANVRIDARDTIVFDGVGSNGFPSGAFSSLAEQAKGKAGSIYIAAGSLAVTNGARLDTSTSGQGNAGNVNINTNDTVAFDGVGSNGFSSVAYSSVEDTATGKAGNINITTSSLEVKNGARLQSLTAGQGNAGNVNINASDMVVFDGVGGSDERQSNVSSRAEAGDFQGDAGNINIATGSLFVTNGALVETSSSRQANAGSLNINARDKVVFDGVGGSNQRSTAVFSTLEEGGIGNAGDINISTSSLEVKNGAQLQSLTAGQGNAANVRIDARDTIVFDGVGSNGFHTALFSTVDDGAKGKGGNINITTGLLSLTNGALLTASSEGNGAAGNIEVAARSIRLDNQALLSSDTIGGQGNIFLRSGDLILRRGSNITTDATGTASGGNINIDTDLLVALQNSYISANAEEAFGGRVIIDTQGIFRTADSDFTASSELGTQFNGTVDINTPGIEPNRGLVNLPVQLVEARVAQTCQPSRNQAQSEFIVTGRGGLPPSPDETLSSDAIQVDWVTLNPKVENRNQGVSTNITTPEPNSIVEATSWTIANNGNVILTASATPALPGNSRQTPAKCHAK